jgi:integrase/recombinase XerD
VYQYAAKLQAFLDWIEPTPLDAVAVETIEAWLNRPRQGRAMGALRAPATIAKDVSLLRGLYGFAVARDLITRDPTSLLHAPTPKNANPRPVPDEEWIRLWSADLSDEARVVLGLGYFCGLRRHEIAELSGRHVDLRAQRLAGFKRKGGGDDVLDYGELLGVVHDALPTLMPGGPETFLCPLQRLVGGAQGGLILQWTMTAPRTRVKHQRPPGVNDPQLIYKRMRRWLREAGVVTALTPHQLRHSFVTNLLRCGVPIHLVSVLANHSSIGVTMRYAKLGGQDLREFRQTQRTRLSAGEYNRWESRCR